MLPVYVGLDYGRRRIGVAVSTPLGTVHPRERILRGSLEEDLAAVRACVEEAGAGAVVVGLPHHMDGAASEMETEARAFAARVATACGVPVYGFDERLTSEAADSALRVRGLDWRARRERRDSAAACVFLQDFLEGGEKAERLA